LLILGISLLNRVAKVNVMGKFWLVQGCSYV